MSYRFCINLEEAIRRILKTTNLFTVKVEISGMAGTTGTSDSHNFSGSFTASPKFLREFIKLCVKYYGWKLNDTY